MTQQFIKQFEYLNKVFWHLNCVFILKWNISNRTVYMFKIDLALNDLRWLICCQTKPKENLIIRFSRRLWVFSVLKQLRAWYFEKFIKKLTTQRYCFLGNEISANVPSRWYEISFILLSVNFDRKIVPYLWH